jgi:hypothetical protein
VDDLVWEFDVDRLMRLKTSVGASKVRFESLAPEVREACVDESRRRMMQLSPEGFIARGKVVYSIGCV